MGWWLLLLLLSLGLRRCGVLIGHFGFNGAHFEMGASVIND